MELQQRLLKSIDPLTEAANWICTDKAFVYDTVYLAVIKTKQKYKKLANKERAVEVCISLMKQPKTHVKHSFSSVEDCIEKAMAAKVVPWRPILSAAAVVLVAAIILPFCLPKKPVHVDPKGFVMEGTQVLANRLEGNDVQLKNFHKISDLGAADIRELANIELDANGSSLGDAQYRIHTTSTGVTFLLQVYVNGDTKKSEFILYKSTENGWQEVGRDTVRYRISSLNDNVLYIADDTAYMHSDESGNLYVFSCYNEGIQAHKYDTDGFFSLVDQVWISEHKLGIYYSGIWMVTMQRSFTASYDPSNKSVSFLCQAELDNLIYDRFFLSFDTRTDRFSEPNLVLENTNQYLYSIISDHSGGFYYLSTEEKLIDDYNYDSAYYYIYHCNSSGNVTEKILYGTQVAYANDIVDSYLLEIQNGDLHFVYRDKATVYYSIYREGVEISKMRIPSLTTDSYDYMAFFFYDNALHYLLEVNNKLIILAKVTGENAKKIAEFELPITFDELSFLYSRGIKSPHFTVNDGVLNYIIGEHDPSRYGLEYISSYFFQIVLE